MKKLSSVVAFAVALASATPALSVAVWGQCGGMYYTGSTSCDAGSSCVYSNPWYSQCLPVTTTTSHSSTSTSKSTTSTTSTSTSSTSTSTTSSTKTTTTSTTSTTTSTGPSNSVCPGARTKFQFFGVNESGAEFGNTAIPGTLNKDYTWPSPSSIDYFMNLGFNTFRIPFLMERISPPATGLTGPFDPTYLSGLKTIASYITGKGGYALVDPHNYMIYNNNTITSTSDFETWWTNLATEFKSDSHIVFDIMNEPHDIPATTVYQLNQAAVNGIRASGATTQLILAEGTSWTGAWTWVSSGNAAAFTGLTDPYNNIAIEMHQYLDSDGSGTSDQCVNATIGSDRLQVATQWLQQTGYKGFLGEIGAGSNPTCVSAVQSALCEMQEAGGSWIGALWWAAGPWWGNYYQSIEPPSGPAIATILPQALEPFL